MVKHMDVKPRVTAVNGSPNRRGGNTGQLLKMLETTLNENGIEMEAICLAEKRIWFCAGCGVCLENEAGKCWINDEHHAIAEKLLTADGVILASPVYIMSVTGQMKVFLDRSLGIGHKPRSTWKPGLGVSVSAGMGETDVVNYLSHPALKIFGAFPVGQLTAISALPGQFLGKEDVERRAADLAGDLARAIIERRRYPATDKDLYFYHFMGNLIKKERDSMKGDYEHWQRQGLYEGFDTYVKQEYTRSEIDPEFRKTVLKKVFVNHNKQYKG